MAFNLTTYGADTLLTFCLDVADSAPRPTTVYLALNTADPSVLGTLNEIGAGLGYTRQAIIFDNPNTNAERGVYNTNIITFGPAIAADSLLHT